MTDVPEYHGIKTNLRCQNIRNHSKTTTDEFHYLKTGFTQKQEFKTKEHCSTHHISRQLLLVHLSAVAFWKKAKSQH